MRSSLAKSLLFRKIRFNHKSFIQFCTKSSSELAETSDLNLLRNKTFLKTALSNETPVNRSEFPSDYEQDIEKFHRLNNAYRDQTRHAYRPEVSAEDTSILLFPPQGSQFVGMGKALLGLPIVKSMYDVASNVLGYDLLDICLNGPRELLDKTVYCQPAVVVTSLAAVEMLKETSPQAIDNCVAAAGCSVGEYAALVFADAISFENAVRLVKRRAELMQKASEEVSSSMMTVVLGPKSKLKYTMQTSRLYCTKKLGFEEDPVCNIAIDMFPEVKVIAGHTEALDFIRQNYRDFGIIRCKPVRVSGAFHTNLMKNAMQSFQSVLKDVEVKRPIIPVYANVSSRIYRTEDSIRKLLAEQLCKPVKWEQTMHVLYSRKKGESFPRTFEVGPGHQMGSVLKKVNSKAYRSYTNIDV